MPIIVALNVCLIEFLQTLTNVNQHPAKTVVHAWTALTIIIVPVIPDIPGCNVT